MDKKALIEKIETANPLELTIINYQLLLARIDEAIAAPAKSEARSAALRRAQNCLNVLYETLNMDVELSRDFAAIYLFVNGVLIRADFERDAATKDVELTQARQMMSEMMEAWQTLLEDVPLLESLAHQAQSSQLFAGLTYGPGGQLNEYEDFDPESGYKI